MLCDGLRRRRPREVYADRGDGFAHKIAHVRERGLTPRVAARQTTSRQATTATTHGSGLGQLRDVVERTLAAFNGWRRLRVSY